ncbi:MAG: winged helix-turn-helix domain-containing protein [Bacteroidales bacterium]|nr:winged helix-turn-helix domain-containing protein [Bacteroidales bacterium]
MSNGNKKTVLILKEKRQVPQKVKDNLKYFVKIKKEILKALKDKKMTVPELSEVINKPKDEILYYLMSLLKYGFVEVDGIDDMDEYFYYKLKDNG